MHTSSPVAGVEMLKPQSVIGCEAKHQSLLFRSRQPMNSRPSGQNVPRRPATRQSHCPFLFLPLSHEQPAQGSPIAKPSRTGAGTPRESRHLRRKGERARRAKRSRVRVNSMGSRRKRRPAKNSARRGLAIFDSALEQSSDKKVRSSTNRLLQIRVPVAHLVSDEAPRPIHLEKIARHVCRRLTIAREKFQYPAQRDIARRYENKADNPRSLEHAELSRAG